MQLRWKVSCCSRISANRSFFYDGIVVAIFFLWCMTTAKIIVQQKSSSEFKTNGSKFSVDHFIGGGKDRAIDIEASNGGEADEFEC